MNLAILENTLRERLAGTLPGLEAQLRFMPTPPRGSRWTPGEFPSDARIAAGLLLVYPGTRGLSIPLTVRASGLRRHAGQISLPGGATDPGETLAQAALREAHEEVALRADGIRVLGALTPIDIPVSGFRLHPIVAATPEAPLLAPADSEVAQILEIPVHDLLDAAHFVRTSRERDGVRYIVPAFRVAGHDVWGATAMVLAEFLALLGWTGQKHW